LCRVWGLLGAWGLVGLGLDRLLGPWPLVCPFGPFVPHGWPMSVLPCWPLTMGSMYLLDWLGVLTKINFRAWWPRDLPLYPPCVGLPTDAWGSGAVGLD
jgi:hypothetical protein